MKAFFRILFLIFFSGTIIVGALYLGLGSLVSFYGTRPQQADVIVVLGGDDGLRVRKGAELYKEGYAKHLLLTGIDNRYYRQGHPNWRERRLVVLGVPKTAINLDTWSETTWEEAENAAETMKRKRWTRAIVVSDPPHMLRLHQTWKRVFKGTDLHFVLVSTSPAWWNPFLWWKNEISYRFVISEVRKNLFYSLLYY